MRIVHGSWIPGAEENFVQAGEFCIWVEALESGRSGQRVVTLADRVHKQSGS